MATLPTPLSEAGAADLVARLYGVAGRAERLDGEIDLNFRIASDAGRFVFKVAPPAQPRDELELQHAALRHLAARAPELPVPRARAARSGAEIETVDLGDGAARSVRLLGWLPGDPLAHIRPHPPELLAGVGRLLGRFSVAMAGFDHPAADRNLAWDLPRALWVTEAWHHIDDPQRRALVQREVGRFEAVLPALAELPESVIHGDANDHNVLVSRAADGSRRPAGLIDFGDMVRSRTVCEVAVAAAYALLDEGDPVGAAARLVGGYHELRPLSEAELALLDPLVRMRLALSVTTSARRRALEPGNPYHSVSEAPAWRALERLAAVPPALARARYRAACGLPPAPHAPRVAAWLAAHRDELRPVIDAGRSDATDATDATDAIDAVVFDLSVGSPDVPDLATFTDPERLAAHLAARQGDAALGVGRYDEARLLYATDAFLAPGEHGPERRTVHLGLDLFAPAGTRVFAPLAGVVRSAAVRPAPLDYGGCVVLEHRVADAAGELAFASLWGHLDPASIAALRPGRELRAGETIGALGAAAVNGGWPPHLHLQLLADDLGLGDAFPGVAPPGQRSVWLGLSPDANLLARIPADRFPRRPRRGGEIAARRREVIGRNLSVSYARPLALVRGAGQYLFDEDGRRFLDAYNNVPHVGHAHPRVVAAAARQMAVLNTNTRYLHDELVRYAERLGATLPEPLRVCFFVNSGSEATELALRLARAHTGQRDLIVSEGAYHGHTTTLIDISPYKAETAGGRGLAPWVHKAPVPDDYRGPYRRGDAGIGPKYAAALDPILERMGAEGRGPCGFMIESLLSCAGQIVPPEGYLAAAYERVRAAGGVCIADEVQVGFGRVGTRMWGFELQGVVPDIVAMGKPIGNGHPLGAVVTTPEIAASFDNGMEWFSTFGGNPVSCAVGLAVLDVLEEEGLQRRAREVGDHLKGLLTELMPAHPILGDVRGAGLFVGLELVRDPDTLEPAAAETAHLADRLRERGILTGTDGVHHNVLKIKPPLPFSRADADRLATTLDEVLREDRFRIG